MLARVIHKKKKRPLLLTEAGESGGGEYQQHGGMPRPNAQQYPYGGGGFGGHAVPSPPLSQQQQQQSSRSQSSRISRAFGGGGGVYDERRGGVEKERKKSAGALVKKVFGGGKKNRAEGDMGDYGKHGPPVHGGGGGVMYSDDDECEFDDDVGECDEEEDEEPQLLRPRRRFVRSGLTTYEQIISKNSMGRRFSRRSYMQQPSQPSTTSVPSPCKADGRDFSGAASPVKGVFTVDKENSPLSGNLDPAGAEHATQRGVSSLSSALQDVINSRPTALKSVVDPSAGPQRVQRSFVVEQTPDGNYFVASKRIPSGPTRQAMDDSFIGLNRQLHDQYAAGAVVGAPSTNPYGPPSAGNAGRRSEMDFMYRQKWGTASALSAASGSSGSTPGSNTTSAASLLSMSKAGVRRRLSGADGAPFVPLGGDSISTAPTAMASAAPRLRRSSSTSKIAETALANQMGNMFVDETRHRSRSRSTDGLILPVMPLRKDSAAILLQRGSFEDVDALPMTMDDLIERKPSIDKGPMTLDEFMFEKPAPPPPPMLQRKGSNGKSGRSKRDSKPDKDDEEEEHNAMNRSFRNLKDVDALKRSRSLEEEEKVVTTTEETETEEEYPDYAEERATDDLGSSYEDESAVRTSNITDFLGGFKSRNSMNRNSLAGRNSLGRNSVGKNDFVSRAARSLRNSRKVALETAKVSSELSRKLREARARVPHDLRGDPPAPTKKRSGFRGRDGKRVRFDMARYVREFEVIEPEVSDDEVQRWAQRDSEQDDEDEDDEEEHSTDDDSVDFGVPVPGAVLAAAMTDANAYYSNPGVNYTYPSRYSVGRQSTQEARYSAAGRTSVQEDKRLSVVSRRSNANQFEVFM